MEITCSSCAAKYNVPDEKIPKDKAFRITCPQCKEKITVEPPGQGAAAAASEAPAPATRDLEGLPENGQHQPAAEAPLYDTATSEYFEEGVKTALLCESDEKRADFLTGILKELDYIVTCPSSHEDALLRLKFNKYDLIVVDEEFAGATPGNNAVLSHLQKLPMAARRYIYLVLLGQKLNTSDNMMAFVKSVNMVVNHKDLENFKNILKRNQTEHETFYKVFMDVLRELGKR
ncbi:MAG: zinc-ribbon domain-containing protein [Candidatus Tectomicrobia bacterium]|uniref:Zinc-ribbon domain-containing protein n=1 Tax=Tectimicrobiota bacterium TaxID=2528274 RepID=A0A932GNQ8_UNCTE|nr:zinc-ribbon domain-containing protein [Candidatus Tectomicrobia bacterium]